MKTFIVLATKNHETIIYMMEEIEIIARSWKEAYQKLRDDDFTPLIDVYIPHVNQ